MSRHPSPPHPPPSRPFHSLGITAGAEDVKYQAKYTDLKRKVREIEGGNDKLQYSILLAKRNIQRIKLERAILYERVSSAPPATDPVTAPPAPPWPTAQPQPSRSYSGSHRDRPIPIPTDSEPLSAEYLRRHDTSRHLAPLPHPHFPPVSHPVSSPPLHPLSSARSSRPPPQQIFPFIPGQQYPDSLPILHSPPPASDRDRSSRRIEPNDYPRLHSRHPSHLSPHMPSPDPRRIPPNPTIPHAFYRDDPARAEWERDSRHRESRERESSIHSPHPTSHYPDYPHSHPPPRTRDDIYYRDPPIPYPSAHVSRSATPGSHNSVIDQPPIPSRPDSRAQLYEERNSARHTSYRLRPISQSSNMTEDLEFVGHDRQDTRLGRSTSHDHPRISLSSTPANANLNPANSGPNNGSSGNTVMVTNTATVTAAGGGGGRESIYAHPPPLPPPPLGPAHSHYERLDRGRETPMRKGNRNDIDMDVDSDKDNMNDMGGQGAEDSRCTTPAPPGIVSEDRDKSSLKRYYDHREGSIPPPPPEPHDN